MLINFSFQLSILKLQGVFGKIDGDKYLNSDELQQEKTLKSRLMPFQVLASHPVLTEVKAL